MTTDAYCLESWSYWFHFFSNEGNEPPYIHVKAGSDEAKFWLDPVELVANYGFNARELNEVEGLVRENRQKLLEAWNQYFSES